jgi:nucleoside-diphosphate-sugar epimerase
VEDAVSSILAADRRGGDGSTWLVSDDRPYRRREYYEMLAWMVAAPVPQFADSPGDSERWQLNKRCQNRRLRDTLHLELRYPTIALGLPQALLAPVDSLVA